MFYLGYAFAGGAHTLDTTPVLSETVRRIELSNGVFDDFYVTRKAELLIPPELPDIWDYDTIIRANFDGDLFGGNVRFSLENTEALRIKRREKGVLDWVAIFEKPVETDNDFSFDFFDYTARSNTNYEYSIFPVYGSVEGNNVSSDITTDFEGLFVVEDGVVFSAQIDISVNSQQQNKPTSVVPTMGKKYPFVIANGIVNYKTGRVEALFAEFDVANCKWDFATSWKYRKRLNDFLYNGKPKLLKYYDGRMWLIAVSGSAISESEWSNVEYLSKTSFDWAEIGDCDSNADLYECGLVNVLA